MKEANTILSENLVVAATEICLCLSHELVAESLKMKPGMSLKEFAKVLDEYTARAKAACATIEVYPTSTPSS